MATTSKILFFICLFSFLSKHIDAVFTPDFVYFDCKNGTFDSEQQNRLSISSVLSDLSAHSSTHNFYNSSSSASGQNNTIYGTFYCTGNVNSQDCHTCVQKAAGNLEGFCRNYNATMVIYKECSLRYSNNTVYGIVDDSVGSGTYSRLNVSISQFNQTVYTALDKVMKQVTDDAGSKFFATGEASLVGTSERLYVYTCTMLSGYSWRPLSILSGTTA